jgi:ligand-binding sensor domain-containing protein
MQPDEGQGVFGNEITSALFEPVWSRELGAPTNQIETIAWKNGGLWVGTPVGLFHFEGNPARVVQHFTRDDGLQATNATAMAFSPSGSLWVGTNGGSPRSIRRPTRSGAP